jgi:heat shock protein HslJ
MSTTLRALLTSTAISALLVGCSGLAIGGPAPGGLDGRTFLSTRVTQNGVDRPLVAGSRIRLTFQADGNLAAHAGCNSIGGAWKLDGGSLSFTGGSMTEMACDHPRMDQDGWLADLLGRQPTVMLSGNDLVLTAGDTVITLLDREVAEPDLPVVGPRWQIESIVTGDVATGGGMSGSITFGADGRATFDTGCNTGGAGYTVDGPTIRFTDVVTTKRACAPGQAASEGPMLALFRAPAVSWSFDASRLSLRDGANGLDFRAG